MKSSITNNELEIRMRILSAFLDSDRQVSIGDVQLQLSGEINDDALTLEYIKFWLNRFENRQFDLGIEMKSDEKPKDPPFGGNAKEMVETLKNKPSSFRSCILFQVLRKKSIDEVYESMCESIGATVNYSEVDYWYYRFYHGNHDLDYERSSDPPPLTFSDLPEVALCEIVQKLAPTTRFVLRKVCKPLRAIVDKIPVDYETVEVIVYASSVHINYNVDGKVISYNEEEEGCLVDNGVIYKKVENGNVLDLAFNDLSIALKNPKTEVKNFEVNLFFVIMESGHSCNKLVEYLASNSKLNVERLEVNTGSPQYLLSILNLLKPRKLEEMKLILQNWTAMMFNEIVQTEHWKQAKEVDIIEQIPVEVISQLKHFCHFHEFDLNISHISPQEFIELVEGLSKSTNFEQCCISFEDPIENATELGKALGEDVIEGLGPLDKIIHCRPINGTENTLRVVITDEQIEIFNKANESNC